MHVLGGHGDQLGVRSVGVLTDHGDAAVAVLEPGVDHDAVADVEPRDALAEARDDPGAVGAEDARLRDGRQPLPDPDVEPVERGRPQGDRAAHRRRAPDRARPRSAAPRGRRPRECGSPSPGGDRTRHNSIHEGGDAGEAGRRARSRRRRSRRSRSLRRDGAAHPRAARARSLRGHALHDVPPRGVVPSGAPARRAHGRSCPRPSATTPTRQSPHPARDACRGTHGGTATRSCARSSIRSAAASAATTACSWTRTSTSTARPPRARESASTGRTRS